MNNIGAPRNGTRGGDFGGMPPAPQLSTILLTKRVRWHSLPGHNGIRWFAETRWTDRDNRDRPILLNSTALQLTPVPPCQPWKPWIPWIPRSPAGHTAPDTPQNALESMVWHVWCGCTGVLPGFLGFLGFTKDSVDSVGVQRWGENPVFN